IEGFIPEENAIGKEVLITGWVNDYASDSKTGYSFATSIQPLRLGHYAPESFHIETSLTLHGIDYALFKNETEKTKGILYANQDGVDWKVHSVIKELANSFNSSDFLDYQNGKLYFLISDNSGAGSGEGVAKLMSLRDGAQAWQ